MKKAEELLHILQNQNEPLPSTALANILHVSSRTIKNHVKLLNEQHDNLILATPKGYLLNKEVTLLNEQKNIPQTYEERFSYITKVFFMDNIKEYSIYDLCDELFLSYSSLKLLISKINTQFEAHGLILKCKQDMIYIEGKERDKRRFLTSAIYQEAEGHFIDTTILKKQFPEIDISFIQKTLRQVFQEHNCYINDFCYANLSLHITIILDRIIHGNAMSETDSNIKFCR